jgi:hypothetical protein
MKKLFKIKYLAFIVVALSPLAAMAADRPADTKRLTPELHEARIAACKADPEKCRAERRARYAQWCAANAERCKVMQSRLEQRMAERKADPEKCRAERRARFEQRFKLADKDGNGMISRAEAEQAMPRMLRRFERIDAGHDGQISKEEIAAARKARFDGQRRRTERPNI